MQADFPINAFATVARVMRGRPTARIASVVPPEARDPGSFAAKPDKRSYVKLRSTVTTALRLCVLAGLLGLMGADARAGSFGTASWYGGRFFEHRLMANGCPYHGSQLTAASRVLPLGAWVLVRNLHNQRSVVVQITDRGPFVAHRILDLSHASAKALDMIAAGIVAVEVQPIAGPLVARCAHLKPRRRLS
jgi:rare lipoprotein A (peptidoglycan hydrolase)